MSKKNFNLIVVKKPRDDPIVDKPINFPPLENLHLEFLENKKKVKPGLPDAPSQKKRPVPVIKKEVAEPAKNTPTKKTSPPSPPKKRKETKPPSQQPPPHTPSEDELILEEIIDEEGTDDEKELKENIVATDEEDITGSDDEEEDITGGDEDEVELEIGESDNEDRKKEKPQEEKKTEPEVEDDIYAGLSPEEREKKEKEEYIWRFRILKKKYKNPSVEIPEFNEHSELMDMKNAYDRTTKELYLDSTVDSYKTYLIGGFMLTEFICTTWAGIDLSGFTTTQTKMMYKYDMLLIELGEKSYNKWGVNLPVEVRLAGLIILQAGLFYLGKVISTNFGGTMSDLFKGFTGQPSDSSSGSSREEPPSKKRMNGPKFKAEDIRNMANVKTKED